MALASAIERFRRRQEALFTEEGRLTRASEDKPTLNTSTGALTYSDPILIYEGPCLVRPGEFVGSDAQIGETEKRLRDVRCKFPVNTPAIKGDELELTTSKHDEELVGRIYHVSDVLHDGWQIARVVILEEVT